MFNENTRFEDICSDRPMMLKDYLRSSSPLNGHPIKKSTTSSKSNNPPPAVILLRSWSKKAAATKVSAVQRVINAVKFLQFVKSPSAVLRRSNSRKLGKDKKDMILREEEEEKVKVKVKVKDILRWKSFRDTVEDEHMPLDYPSSSPNRTTTTTTTTSSCSKSSSWCDSDFTAEEELPFWQGENDEGILSKKGFESNATLLNNTKGDWSNEECEQQSPVSVFDSPFEEVTISPSHQVNNDDHIIYDFFVHELSINGKLHDVEFDHEILSRAKSWINGKYDESYEWEVENNRNAYVKDMEKGVSWNNFKQEQEQMSVEIEVMFLNELIDQALIDFLTK